MRASPDIVPTTLVDMVVLYFDDTTVIFASNIWYQSIISIVRSTEVILVVDSKIRTNIIHHNTGEMETLVLLVMGVFVIHPVLALYGELC